MMAEFWGELVYTVRQTTLLNANTELQIETKFSLIHKHIRNGQQTHMHINILIAIGMCQYSAQQYSDSPKYD